MALVKFDAVSFIESLEPGIVAFVGKQFEQKIEVKLNALVEQVYAELLKELPIEIKGKVMTALDPMYQDTNVKIEVDIKTSYKEV